MPPPGTDGTSNTLRFLKPGKTFASEIRFHNVTPVELGALVWTVTLGQQGGPDRGYRHMLGRAKAHGFGQVRATITGATVCDVLADSTEKADDALASIHSAMGTFTEWVADRIAERRGAEREPFETLEPVALLLAAADRARGKDLKARLAFPERNLGAANERVLKGYVAIRRAAFAQGRNRAPGPGSPDFVGLPPYPTEVDP